MPIKNVSDRMRMVRAGKIRLGEKVHKGNKEYPKALDYFVVPEEVKQAINEDKPRQLDIIFPSSNLEVVFPQYFKRYGQTKGLICKGDGDKATSINEETGEMNEDRNCAGEDCPYFLKGECRMVGSLLFFLYKVPGIRAYQLDTSSYNSIVNINSQFRTIDIQLQSMANRAIAGVKLLLKVEMEEAHPTVEQKGKKKKIKTFVPVVHLDANFSLEQLAQSTHTTQALPGPTPKPSESKPELLYPPRNEKDTTKQPPESEPEPAKESTEKEDKPEQKSDQPKSEQKQPEKTEEEPDKPVLNKQINALFDELSFPSSRRMAWWSKHKNDLQSLLKALQEHKSNSKNTEDQEPQEQNKDNPKSDKPKSEQKLPDGFAF